MAEKNKLASIPGQPLPERRSNLLADLWDEASGAFARYGRRSGAQRDASLALMSQAADPNTDPLTGAGMKALGLAGLVTHPLAFFPTREEWDQRLQAAGNDSRLGRSIGGFLSDLPSLIDPQMAAGGAATVAPAIFAGMMAKTADLNKLKQAEKLAELGHSAEDIHDMTGWFKGADNKWRFEIDDSTARVSEMMKSAAGQPDGVRAGSSFMHPDLYAAYPQLAETRITNSVPSGARGASYSGRVGVSDELPSWEAKSTLLHELQHEIQNIEGFAKGGNVAEFAFIPKEQAEEALWLKNYIEMEGSTQAGVERFTRTIGRAPHEKAVKAAEIMPYDDLVGATNPERAYRKLAGETEARNVQFRRGMTKQERAASLPLSTQDIPSDQQTLRGVR